VKKVESGLSFPLHIYSSLYRDVGLTMCGWKYGDNSSLFDETIARLHYDADFERAAGLTFLFYGDMARTIEILNSSRGIVF
jgi:hypothetical protein